MKINIALSDKEIEQAIRERVLAKLKNKGMVVPYDTLEFHNTAEVKLYGGPGVEVIVDAAVVTWDNG